MLPLPPEFVRTIEGVYGDTGREWLLKLPDLVDEFSRRWSLQIGPPFDLSFNYVAPAMRTDGAEVVLKAGVPCRELLTEISALSHYAAHGSVRLLDSDLEQGVMLLERVCPGTMLTSVVEDEDATRIAAGVIRKLHRPPPADHDFPTVSDWAQGKERLRHHYGGGTGPFPRELVEEAESIFAELLPTQGPAVLLHGDLHHFNILKSRDGWLAIDPKGLVGEAEYEVGALLRNPDPARLARPEAVAIQKRRIEILAEELGFDKARLRDWAVAQAVLSGWWTVEDGGKLDATWIACMERLSEVRF